MTSDDLIATAVEAIDTVRPGAYYGSAAGLSLGAGLIVNGVRIPSWNAPDRRFEIRSSMVLVITHECDVANEREFNDHLLVCPIIPLRAYTDVQVRMKKTDHAFNLLKKIAANLVYRVFFLPPPPPLLGLEKALADGGLIYLNRMTSAHIDLLKEPSVTTVCALSDYAQNRFDMKMTQHVFRPKQERLPRLIG